MVDFCGYVVVFLRKGLFLGDFISFLNTLSTKQADDPAPLLPFLATQKSTLRPRAEACFCLLFSSLHGRLMRLRIKSGR